MDVASFRSESDLAGVRATAALDSSTRFFAALLGAAARAKEVFLAQREAAITAAP